MSYKDSSYLELWWPFCSAGQNHLCNFDVRYQEEQFYEIIINLNQLFRRSEMSFNFFSYLELWQPSLTVEWNHLRNFERGQYEKDSCEVI